MQEKLWSDRGGEQAAASLRQALRDIRRHLGVHRGILRSDRVSVSLDGVLLDVSFQPPIRPDPAELEADLFEDLDIADPQFRAWIRYQRQAVETHLAASNSNCQQPAGVRLSNRRRAVLFVTTGSSRGGSGERMARLAFSLAADAIRPNIDAEFIYSYDSKVTSRDPETDQAVVIKARVGDFSGLVSIAVAVSDLASKCVVYTEEITLPSGEVDPAYLPHFVRMVNRIAKAALDALMRGTEPAADDRVMALRLFNSARMLTFTLGKENLELADQQCMAAFERCPRGSLLAWRSFIRQISHFHHLTCDFLSDRQSSGHLTTNALDRFPDDSLVLSLGAHAEYLFGNSTSSALRLARHAITANALDPLAWAALSNLQTATSDHRASYRSARRAIDLSAGTPASYFFEFYGCMAAAGLGAYGVAAQHARASRLSSPRFAPPQRYMVALKASAEDQRGFRRAIQGLKALEPSFELDLLLEGSYPVNTMRRMPLIDIVEGRVRRAATLESC
ncbi:hypothetical protein NKH52_17755 [Mesorhizobium sp. M1066]|uniref:hypothetical protein n=1 Tax=unclassified Mesorhizobium TaxID=325217 RepID=UPI003336D9A7